jgi:hypothetical protein
MRGEMVPSTNDAARQGATMMLKSCISAEQFEEQSPHEGASNAIVGTATSEELDNEAKGNEMKMMRGST